MSFSELLLPPVLCQLLEKLGYETPTPVQNKVIPKVLKGCDLRVSAPTGTGKTAAFMLPALTALSRPSMIKGSGPRVLILVPTRELAIQVASQATKYSKNSKQIKTLCIYGGVPYRDQLRDLRNKYEIIVATPGRLIDHLEQGRIHLSRVEMFILDEADRMLDMGFSEPVNQIADAITTEHQTLLFSATLKGNVLSLSQRLLKNPLEIVVQADREELLNIDQRLHYVDNIQHKHKILLHLLANSEIEQAIVFTSTKRLAEELAMTLIKTGYSAAALHGDKNQRQRTQTIDRLRKGFVKILIATDVASRGIDIKNISHVINFDMPKESEDYIHRIGRTGRAGAVGKALSFATYREQSMIYSIEKLTGQKMTCDVIPTLEPKQKSESKPRRFAPKTTPHKIPSGRKKPFKPFKKGNRG